MKKTPSPKPLRLDRTTIARLDEASLPAIAGAFKSKSIGGCTDYVSCACPWTH